MREEPFRHPIREAERAPNYQVAALALWLLGGATVRQLTDDVAVKCWNLAPHRFSWERYPEYPNLDTARVALSDAKKAKYGALVEGDNKSGWLLTEAGAKWALANASLPDLEGTESLRLHSSRVLAALKKHPLYQKWLMRAPFPDPPEVADAIELPADTPRRVIMRKLDSLGNSASLSKQEEVEGYVRWLRDALES